MTEAHARTSAVSFDTTAIALDIASSSSAHHRYPLSPSAMLSSSGSSSSGNSPMPLTLDGHQSIADHLSYQLAQMDPIESFSFHTNNDLIDQSNHHSAEKVVELSPNKRYGRLNTLLGKGAFKVVHKAIDREEGYEVAWNVLQISQEHNKGIGHEIEILKSVRHPNIIAFHDAWLGGSKTEFVFVTELMTSGTLREYIRKLSLPNAKIIKRWSRQILKGLDYLHLHDPPIIHRDIKCDNIFINGAHGEIKIGDLGTAENMWLGKKYTLIGTPEFMAPEMYDSRGYSEKVDIYAFGMCLLEMVTGEYPYSECTNAAQIYRKVSQNQEPDSLAKVQNKQVLEVIHCCLSRNEHDRLSAQELLERPFLAVEPDVVLLASDPTHKVLTLQLVFKGSDKVSVKFELNIEKDTAEDVVAEMIEEQVLPDRYRHWITGEINRILRDIDKDGSVQADDKYSEQAVWRRENDIRTELEKARRDLANMKACAVESEKRCDVLHQQMVQAETRQREALQKLELLKSTSHDSSEAESLLDSAAAWSDDTHIDVFVRATAAATNRDEEKALQWADKLQSQDILTVGDLRELLDEDWSSIGLTVFALRALKNMLRHGKVSKTLDGTLSDDYSSMT